MSYSYINYCVHNAFSMIMIITYSIVSVPTRCKQPRIGDYNATLQNFYTLTFARHLHFYLCRGRGRQWGKYVRSMLRSAWSNLQHGVGRFFVDIQDSAHSVCAHFTRWLCGSSLVRNTWGAWNLSKYRYRLLWGTGNIRILCFFFRIAGELRCFS